jgi:hypothetical protein
LQGDPNRFIDEEAELREEPVETGVVPRDRENECPVYEHAVPIRRVPASGYRGEMAESESP